MQKAPNTWLSCEQLPCYLSAAFDHLSFVGNILVFLHGCYFKLARFNFQYQVMQTLMMRSFYVPLLEFVATFASWPRNRQVASPTILNDHELSGPPKNSLKLSKVMSSLPLQNKGNRIISALVTSAVLACAKKV